jgi:NAD(P)-dependent dehydrogenase (short-subunit alcohol dehydrogenase family)
MNMLALGYAHRFRSQGWKVNIHNPGYTATDLNGHSGTQSVEEGARCGVRLATLGHDGETATFQENEGTLPW